MAEEWQRLARAAIAYSTGGEQAMETVAERLNVSSSTLRRRLRQPGSAWREYELEAWLKRLAAACGVPQSFFTVGFEPLDQLDRERAAHGGAALRERELDDPESEAEAGQRT